MHPVTRIPWLDHWSVLWSSSQKTGDVHPMLVKSWPRVVDGGPALNQHCANVSLLLAVPQDHSPAAPYMVNAIHSGNHLSNHWPTLVLRWVKVLDAGLALNQSWIMLDSRSWKHCAILNKCNGLVTVRDAYYTQGLRQKCLRWGMSKRGRGLGVLPLEKTFLVLKCAYKMAYFNWNDSEIWNTFFIFFANKGGFSRWCRVRVSAPPPLGHPLAETMSRLVLCWTTVCDVGPASTQH